MGNQEERRQKEKKNGTTHKQSASVRVIQCSSSGFSPREHSAHRRLCPQNRKNNFSHFGLGSLTAYFFAFFFSGYLAACGYMLSTFSNGFGSRAPTLRFHDSFFESSRQM